MTGAYLRVKRNGKWENIEVEHLTSAERAEIFGDRSTEELLRWLDLTCEKLRENERLLNELVKDGILETAQ